VADKQVVPCHPSVGVTQLATQYPVCVSGTGGINSLRLLTVTADTRMPLKLCDVQADSESDPINSVLLSVNRKGTDIVNRCDV
jgi:hypothetical protein